MARNGAGWINDSKATNINAMRQALEAVPGQVVLIAGGRDKGTDSTSILPLVQQKVAMLIALGESKAKIVSAFAGVVPVQPASSLQEAVTLAHEVASQGYTVLFSPGCSSFDMFENFEDRGRRFKECVHQLPIC